MQLLVVERIQCFRAAHGDDCDRTATLQIDSHRFYSFTGVASA